MRHVFRNARRRARSYVNVRSLLIGRQRRNTAGAHRFAALCVVALLAFVAVMLVSHSASAQSLTFGAGLPGMLGVMGLILPRPLLQRLDPKVGYNGEGSVATFELPRALLYRGIVLHGKYTDTISSGATSVKTYGLPIERIDVVAENGIVLHSARPTDLVREKQTEAGMPLGAMLVPPAAVGVGAQLGSFEVPLSFDLDDVKDGQDFMLPAWRFEQVQINVYFTNTHGNIYTGGVGIITFQELSVTFRAVVDLPQRMISDPNYLINETELLLRSFKEKVVAAVADAASVIEVPRSADIERIYIITEDANRDPIATMLNAVTLLENGQVRRLSAVPAASLRNVGSERQPQTLPVGWHIIDFTNPSDTIQAALPATKMNSLDLVLDLAAVAGNCRAVFVRKAP